MVKYNIEFNFIIIITGFQTKNCHPRSYSCHVIEDPLTDSHSLNIDNINNIDIGGFHALMNR